MNYKKKNNIYKLCKIFRIILIKSPFKHLAYLLLDVKNSQNLNCEAFKLYRVLLTA